MINLQAQHTQGPSPMKDTHRWRKPRLALMAMLMPLAVASTAQNAADQAPAPRLAMVETASPVAAPAATPVPAASASVASRPAPEGPPLPADFDVARFEAMAQAMVSSGRVPGMALAIVKDGRVLTARGYGTTDVDTGEGVGAHTVFRLASLSKAFAGTVTGMLVSEGALRWDSRVADFMPELQLSQPGAAQRLTVAEVLSHRVGLTHNAYDRMIEDGVGYRSVVQKLAYAPMTCAPGECYAYQNVAFSLVGDVVFAATGRFYSEAVTGRIFKPLGMDDASYGLDGIRASQSWARPHVRSRRGWVSLDAPKPTYYRIAPAAGVNASISDMAQWLIAQTGHRPDVLPAPLLATLHAPVVSTPGETRGSSWRRARLEHAGYGIGWRVYDYAGHRVVYHGGAVQGYRGAIALLPERDLGLVVLWNSSSGLPGGLVPTIIDSALGIADGDWLDLDEDDVELLYAARKQARPDDSGAEASTAHAQPR
jgi:beta-lactamase class C